MAGDERPDEFALIERLFAPLGQGAPGALGLRDDAALLDVPEGHRLVVTTDAVVAGVHFLPDDPADLVARKMLRVNLSDVAAMGARPVGFVVAAAFARAGGGAWIEGFAAGLAQDVAAFGVPLLGGDTVATPGPATLAATAFGVVPVGRELRRSGARPGDVVYVSGSIGDAALGLAVLKGEAPGLAREHADALAERYRLPRPRIELGPALLGLATAAIDISDGLCADLGHVCAQSNVAAEVEAARVPLSPAARAAVAERPQWLARVLTGGDDYELLFTAPAGREAEVAALAARLGVAITPIGRVEEGAGVRVRDAEGRLMALPSPGYQHFGGARA